MHLRPVRPRPLIIARATQVRSGALLFAAALPTRLSAQDPGQAHRTPVAPGATVRVEGRALPIDAAPATVIEQRGDTLVLRARDGGLASVPIDRVDRLEVAQGRRPRSDGAWRGARVGALVGGVPMTLLTSYAIGTDVRAARRGGGDCMIGCPASPYVAAGGLVLTGISTLLGAVIGAAAAPRDRWTRVDPRVRVGAAPTPRGGGVLTLSYRF